MYINSSRQMKLDDNSTKLSNMISLKLLPKDIKISTITITCAISSEFNLENIARYINIRPIGITKIKYGKNPECNLEILTNQVKKFKKKRKKKIKKEKSKNKKYNEQFLNTPVKINKKNKVFYNQATLIVKPRKYPKVNIKIFSNGSFQITGCKSFNHYVEALTLLFEEFANKKAVLNLKTNKIILKPYVIDKTHLHINKVHSFNISIINSGFHIGFEIYRSKLFNLLINANVECSYEPLVHACVNIKYYTADNRKVSIFVFQKGSIIITGANKCEQIVAAYDFICKFIYKNYNEVMGLDDVIDDIIRTDINKIDEIVMQPING
jgi:TATA-box binding protein (TBP) (component of TFIID and TFIIIB)